MAWTRFAMAGDRMLDMHPGVIGTAIVHDDNLQTLPGIVRARDRVDGFDDHRAFVVSGDDDGHAWGVLERGRSIGPVGKPKQRPKCQ